MAGKFVKKYYDTGILKFEGIALDDKPNGFGKSYYPNGKLQYEGTWINGSYNGKGILYNTDGIEIYSGEFSDGMPLKGNGYNDHISENNFLKNALIQDADVVIDEDSDNLNLAEDSRRYRSIH